MAIESSRDPRAFRDFEHAGWETVSLGYERHFPSHRSNRPSDAECRTCRQGTRLLDVCTGPGILAGAALERGAQVVGLDFSGKLIDIARRKVPGAEFQQGDAQPLPFEDESFDAVVCGYGVIHVPEPQKALSEMHRVLKPGGYLAASVWEAQSRLTVSGFSSVRSRSTATSTCLCLTGPISFSSASPRN